MKFTIKIMLILLITSLFINLNSQNFCRSSFNNLDPFLDFEQIENLKRLEEKTANFRKEKQSLRTEDIYTIPIVFHIVMENPNSISNEKVQSQLNRLNEDFRALNPDLINVPTNFIDKIGDTRIQFRLSNLGPNCDGIIRKTTSIACFNWESDEIKFDSEGGSNVIDPEHILNFWVGNICSTNQGNLNGYAQFPGGNWQTDGVVVIPEVFGHTPAGFNTILGRTGTHEVGHYFNLRHIWGDDALQINNCLGTDFCDDTPNQGVPNQSCPSFPHISCSNGPNGDMFMNYMDLTSDLCKIMFSKDQVIRIHAALLNDRSALLTSGPFEVCCALKNQSPILNTSYYENECGTNSIDLSQFVIGNAPNFSNVVWSTDDNPLDGVSPVLNEIVNVSGTYYAYYYVEAANCFSTPSSAIEILIIDKTPINDIFINENTIIGSNELIRGNLVVSNGVEIKLHSENFMFLENKGIIVKNGGTLILQNTIIDACNANQSWAGIKIESGGFFDTDDTYLNNVLNGIDAKANSTLQVYNLNIFGKGLSTGTGFKIDGNVNIDFIYYLTIRDFDTGINASNSTKPIELNHGFVTYTTHAIKSSSAPMIINDYGIDFSKSGIYLLNSPLSSIYDSDIWVQEQGISLLFSHKTTIRDNWVFNLNNVNTWPAISLVLSDDCSILDNPQISSATNAVASYGSSGITIDGNFIETQLNTNTQLAGGPVNFAFGNNNMISNNCIEGTHSEFCINTTWNSGSTIDKNNIIANGLGKFFRTSAIKQTGNVDETVSANYVDNVDLATGIIVQNSSGGTYDCNDVYSTDEGLGIYHALDEQWITSNTIDAIINDLSIRSVIGEQAIRNTNNIVVSNNGNEFVGGYTLA